MQKIRFRDLRYYLFTGLIFGGINGLFAFAPKLISGLQWIGDDSLTQLWNQGPVVAFWVGGLFQLAIGVPLFALFGALIAAPVGYFQLRRFRRRLAEPTDARRPEA